MLPATAKLKYQGDIVSIYEDVDKSDIRNMLSETSLKPDPIKIICLYIDEHKVWYMKDHYIIKCYDISHLLDEVCYHEIGEWSLQTTELTKRKGLNNVIKWHQYKNIQIRYRIVDNQCKHIDLRHGKTHYCWRDETEVRYTFNYWIEQLCEGDYNGIETVGMVSIFLKYIE